ncbi:hypothetical protein C0993_004846, partial [Termitomyces sp. T159_Od127]
MDEKPKKRRPLSIQVSGVQMPDPVKSAANRLSRDRRSLQFTPTTPVFPRRASGMPPHGYGHGRLRSSVDVEAGEFAQQQEINASLGRRSVRPERLRWDHPQEEKTEVIEKRKWKIRSSKRQGSAKESQEASQQEA